ncbi:LamG-like jellyroll fold domain-containing protein [Streptomyces enissocaesilis]|uniref:LamG domain-containing protein n=1 Tax=Streptomyces enissocaesilis TaxID=332589 RepID=A0ABN3X1M0_9ACTN
MPALGGPAFAQPLAPAAASADSQPVSPESRAALQAAETGERVEVSAQRTESSQVFANPDGTFTQETNAAPVRARQTDGTWAPIDTTLERGGDGRVRAKSTTTAVEFSAGGNDSMVSLSKDDKKLALHWPAALPTPRVEGNSATYADVLPDVDLKLSATATGFTQVLIVNTAEAAAHPGLEELRLSVETDGVEALPGHDGGLRFVDENGAKVFEGPGARMWDSAGDQLSAAAMRTAAVQTVAADEQRPDNGGSNDPAVAPSAGDAIAAVAVDVTSNALQIKPDLALLRGENTVFPVFIDPPTTGLTRADWTAVSSKGGRYWEWDGDEGVGYCKDYAGYLCSYTPYTQRMYFEYPLAKLHGKKILDATFEVYQAWTFTCDPHWYNLSLVDRGISSSTTWSSRPVAKDLMGDRYVAYGRGSLCSPSQPADWVRFSDNVGDETNENLTPTVQSHADDQRSQITFSLTAADESSTASWARFRDDAKLSVTYVSKPSMPTSTGVREGTTGRACERWQEPFTTSDTTPRVVATVQSSDGTNSQLRAQFEVWKEAATSKAWGVVDPSSTWVTDNSVRDADVSTSTGAAMLEKNVQYRVRARTQAYYSTDRGATGTLYSDWTSWCYFKVDTDSPPKPKITSADGLYKPADTYPAAGEVGLAGKFTFTAADTNTATPAIDSDVTSFRYRLNSGALSGAKPVSTGKSWTGTITPDQAGENTLRVWAYDAAGHSSLTGYYSFKVAGAQPPSGTWHLDNSGADTTTATQHPLTTGGSAAYTTLERAGSHALKTNGTSAYAATSAPPIDTSKSYTVAAWARVTPGSGGTHTVLGLNGSFYSGFYLSYQESEKTWTMRSSPKDDETGNLSDQGVVAKQPATLGVWTHLAGVYDAADQQIRLYVNGQLQGSDAAPSAWRATGGLQVGRVLWRDTYTDFFNGSIDEVNTWSRALADTEIMQAARTEDEDASDETAGDPIVGKVGHWDATAASGTNITDTSGYARTMTLTGASLGADPADAENAELGLPVRQVMALNGTSSYASVTGPLVDDTGSFTVTAWARLDGSKLSDTSKSYAVQVFGQAGQTQSSWGVWYEQPAGSTAGKWKFGRPGKDGTSPTWASAQSAVAEKDTWVRLTAVYDAQQETETDGTTEHGALFLYVDTAQMSGSTGVAFNTPWQGSGKLQVGRALVDGATSRYFPGHVADLRVWAGAMDGSMIGDLYGAEQ